MGHLIINNNDHLRLSLNDVYNIIIKEVSVSGTRSTIPLVQFFYYRIGGARKAKARFERTTHAPISECGNRTHAGYIVHVHSTQRSTKLAKTQYSEKINVR